MPHKNGTSVDEDAATAYADREASGEENADDR
jgi:hypothetical protein